MNFIWYDITFLILFAIFAGWFLYRGKKNLKKDGLLFLYRTKWGIKLINYVGKKYKKSLRALSYVSIGTGYCLMAGMLYLFYTLLKIYFFNPEAVRAIKVPPITPLIPYLPQVFKLDFLPPFYFSYWIIILAVIAITHEFSHGIFMRRYNIKIKSTGFAFFPWFFPIFPAAFVEQDEKSMNRSKKFEQMAVLSAGTFANVLTAIFFFAVLWIFFSLAFSPSGVAFDIYPYALVSVGNISSINGISLTNPSYTEVVSLANSGRFNEIKAGNQSFLATKDFLEEQKDNSKSVVLFYDSPSIRANITGVIIEIDEEKIKNIDDVEKVLLQKSPGEKVKIKTKIDDKIEDFEIELGENPEKENLAWLGIAFIEHETSGLKGKIYKFISSFKEPHVYYEPKIESGVFFYNLLWWLILISVSVALVNMLPVGIFDGGRFFYLTLLGLTKNEKLSKGVFSTVTYLFLISLALLILFWFFHL